MAAFGIKAIQPQDNEHIFGFATARGTADDSLLEVWNGPTQSDLRFTIDKEGQLQGRDGSAARPTYSFETDKDTGRYLSGAASMLDVVSGTAVGTWTAGKLTLVELQVDNINVNGNTISSTAGTDLLITPLAGQQIVLDGTIIIDAGVVTGATAITSSSFVGALTGNADSATTATTATNVTASANNSSDETVYPTFVDGATGAQGIETDTGLTYNPSTGVLTATTFTGAMSGTAAVATAVTVTDNESTNENNLITFVAGAATATGSHGLEMDGNLYYNPSTGKVTATGFIGALTGDASGNAATATALETARTIGGTSFNGTANIVPGTITVADTSDTSCSVALFESATGDLAPKSDSGITYNAGTGTLTATALAGPLTGNVTGTASVATTVTITDNESTNQDNALIFAAGGDVDGGNLGLESDGTLTYNPSTGSITATGFIGALTGNASGSSGSCTGNAATATALATARNIGGTSFDGTGNIVPATITVADTTNTSCSVALFESSTGDLEPKSDGGLTYNAGTGVLTAAGFVGPITGAVTGAASVATTVTISDNESTNEDNGLVFTSGGDLTGNLALESDGTLTYNPSTGKITATGFIGALTGNASGSSGSCTGNSATATLATEATSVTASANNSGDETVYPTFVDGATGTQGIETDTGLTYNPSSGILTTTQVTGALAGNASTATALATARAINGVDFDGTGAITVTAAAGTLTGGTLASGVTASSLTSVGTLTSLTTSGDIVIDATDKIRLDGSASGNTYLRESSADVVTLTTEGEDSFHLATSGGNPYIKINSLNTGVGGIQYWEENGSGTSEFKWQASCRGSDNNYYISDQTSGIESNYALMCTGSRAVTIGGALDAASSTSAVKAFKIDHPLDSMKSTHSLSHSSIEGPRADLVYRGQIDLVDGQATVEMDAEFGMTTGTWEALCREATCFTTNETGWHMVKGSVSGSTLTIQCQESDCTDTVSWMVVAERNDPTYLASIITDDAGELIIEAEKP